MSSRMGRFIKPRHLNIIWVNVNCIFPTMPTMPSCSSTQHLLNLQLQGRQICHTNNIKHHHQHHQLTRAAFFFYTFIFPIASRPWFDTQCRLPVAGCRHTEICIPHKIERNASSNWKCITAVRYASCADMFIYNMMKMQPNGLAGPVAAPPLHSGSGIMKYMREYMSANISNCNTFYKVICINIAFRHCFSKLKNEKWWA